MENESVVNGAGIQHGDRNGGKEMRETCLEDLD